MILNPGEGRNGERYLVSATRRSGLGLLSGIPNRPK